MIILRQSTAPLRELLSGGSGGILTMIFKAISVTVEPLMFVTFYFRVFFIFFLFRE